MRTIAAALFVVAIPSMAQAQLVPRSPPGTAYGNGRIEVRVGHGDAYVERELDRAHRDIERRRDSGELSRREAKRLRKEARRIEAMSDRYGRDGLSELERRELAVRASELRNRTATGRVRQAQ